MAYLALLWKARTIEKYRLKYEKEKINSINSKTELRSSLYQKWTVYRNDSQKKLEQIYRNLCPQGSRLANSCTFVKENSSFLLKIVIGIVGGFLTYFLYTVFVCQLSVWTLLGWTIGVAIILGVAFNYTVRCLVLLLIPGLFSRIGRYTLACYALVLILTGPAANTLKNLDTLSASLACGQEHIQSSVKEIKESKDSPLNLVKDTMGGTIEKIDHLAAKMKSMMVRIHRLTMSIAHVLQSSLSWLNSIEVICNKKLGTPCEHCTKVLAKGTKDCQKEWPEDSVLWDWKLVVQAVCFDLRPAEPLCVVGDFAKGSIVATVKKKLNTYSTGVQSLLATGVHIHRSHSCCNGSLPVNQAAAGVITDLRNRADTLLAWLSWTCALTGLFLMLIIFRAKYYLHMFRTRSRFDNRYVTKELRDLDLRRQRQGRDTVLPLNTRERAKYVSTSSTRLLPSEKMYLARSIVFMVITTLKLMIHMVADYSLYWVLMNVRFHGSERTEFQLSNRTERILVSGSGPLAATVRTLVEALSVPLIQPAASTAACLPDPNPPDLQRYAQIGTFILLLWLLAIFEPYGLRLRHVISGHYQPERAKARAVWLYYHIIRTRSCFLKYARRKLHRQFKYTSEEKFTFKNWLNRCIPCQWLRCLLRTGPAEPHCLLCYTKHRQEDLDRHLKRCETPSCPGVYCTRCFSDIGQLCTICYLPDDYGDLSDVSLEKFSNDDSDDNDDDDDADNIPLIGRLDCEIENYKNVVQRNRNKKNNTRFFEIEGRNSNQESSPLLDHNHLNKNYTHQGINEINHDNVFAKRQVERDFPVKDETFDNTGEEITDNIHNNNEVYCPKGTRTPIVFKDTEVTVNGVTIPKAKLSAIKKIMMLLTAKDENCNKYKSNITRHKSFEYLVMEMFDPFEKFHKMSLLRRNKCTNSEHHVTGINKLRSMEVRSLFDNKGFTIKSNSTEAILNLDLQTDFNFKSSEAILKHVHSVQKKNKEAMTKLSKKMWSTRRNVKRFLDVKNSITTSIADRSKNFRINRNKHRFTCKKRNRRTKSDVGLGFFSVLRKAFSNKSIDHVISAPLQDHHAEVNDTPVKVRTSIKQRIQAACFVKHLKSARQDKECGKTIKSYNLSTTAKQGTILIQSSNESYDEFISEQSNEVSGSETPNDVDLKTSAVQTEQTKKRKPGFWESLRVRRPRTRPQHFISLNLKKEPPCYNFFVNHKKRKKSEIQKDIANPKAVDFDVDKRNDIELSHPEEDDLYRRMAKYNDITHIESNELLLSHVTNLSEYVKKEKLEIKNLKREKFKGKSDKANNEKTEFKENPAEQLHQDCDQDTKTKTNAKISKLTTKTLNPITQVAFPYSTPRRVAFSDKTGLVIKISESYYDDDSMIQDKFNDDLENKPPCKHSKVRNYANFNISSDEDDFKHLQNNAKNSHLESNELKKKAPCRLSKVTNYVNVYKSSDEDNFKTKNGKNSHLEINELNKKKPPCRISKVTNYVNVYKSLDEADVETLKNNAKTGPLEVIENVQSSSGTQLPEHCFHIWNVKPKKLKDVEMESLESDKEDESSDDTDDTLERCLRVSDQIYKDADKKTSVVNTLLEDSKSTRTRCKCNERLLSDIEKEAALKLEDKWCYCEHRSDQSKQQGTYSQAHQSCCYVENQCKQVPSAISDEKKVSPPRHISLLNEVPISVFPEDRNVCNLMNMKPFLEATVYSTDSSEVKLEYADERTPKTKKKVSITANRSTTTVARAVANVSTETSDWWSPIPERKPTKITTEVTIEKGSPSKKRRVVVADSGDTLAPSNYLLQSERYYNQVYNMELMSSSRGSQSRIKDICDTRTYSIFKKYPVSEKPSFKMYRPLGKKGSKTKRKKDYSSSRNKINGSSGPSVIVMPSPTPVKWQPVITDEHSHALKYFKCRNPKSKKNHKWNKVKPERKSELPENSQTSSKMWTSSIFSGTC